jgi:hypothetical protein
MQIGVDPLTSCTMVDDDVESEFPIIPLNITRILFDELVGVIETDKPVMSTYEALVVENVSVLTVCTTCNTLPLASLTLEHLP